jgi:hypothetical protein
LFTNFIALIASTPKVFTLNWILPIKGNTDIPKENTIG